MQAGCSAPAGETSELVELLIAGARYNDLEDVQNALSQGVSVDAQDEQGRTGELLCSRGFLEQLSVHLSVTLRCCADKKGHIKSPVLQLVLLAALH